MQKYNLEGLRACLKEFNESGKTASCGKWKIARGGYDLNWELYYNNEAIMQCIDKRICTISNNEKPGINEVVKTVLDEYKDLKRTFTVTCTVIYNGDISVCAADEDEAVEKAREMLCSNDDTFPGEAHIGKISFSFGEATADYADEEY